MKSLSFRWSLVLLVILLPSFAAAQSFDEKFEHWPTDLKISGRILLCGGNTIPTEVFEYVRQFQKRTESESMLIRVEDDNGNQRNEIQDRLEIDGLMEKTLSLADAESALKTLNGLTAVKILWIDAAKSLDEKFKPIMSQLIEKANQGVADGGLLVLSGSIVESAGSLQTSGFLNFVKTKVGFGLYPDCLIRSNYDDARDRKSILSTLAAFPRAVGIGIESDSAILLNRRKIRVLGDGQATFLLMANTQKPIRIQQVRQAKLMRNNPYETTIDLTAWRRDAMDRTLPAFPPSKPLSPYVEKGTLIIVGGGGMPRGLMNQMVEMAGGSEARMVYVPCSEADEVSSQQRIVKSWIDMGVKSATFIHTKDRNKANSDDEFLEPLKNATGIWFGGGRQWNFADSYYGTQAHQLMKQVLQRGGVIGGSSAGASVQARYMCRANPVANFDIMAPGYERGLGFIGGVAIDQHFSQRRRQKDMTQLVNRYPQLLGIGIDEATAIIVRQSKADVIGRGKVHFYDRNRPVIPGEDDFIALQAGQSFDLAKRAILEESTGEKE